MRKKNVSKLKWK